MSRERQCTSITQGTMRNVQPADDASVARRRVTSKELTKLERGRKEVERTRRTSPDRSVFSAVRLRRRGRREEMGYRNQKAVCSSGTRDRLTMGLLRCTANRFRVLFCSLAFVPLCLGICSHLSSLRRVLCLPFNVRYQLCCVISFVLRMIRLVILVLDFEMEKIKVPSLSAEMPSRVSNVYHAAAIVG